MYLEYFREYHTTTYNQGPTCWYYKNLLLYKQQALINQTMLLQKVGRNLLS